MATIKSSGNYYSIDTTAQDSEIVLNTANTYVDKNIKLNFNLTSVSIENSENGDICLIFE